MNSATSSLPLNLLLLAGLLLALLAGCKTHLEPASYSPDYQAITRADGRVELIPVECLKPSAEDQFDTDEDFVPLLEVAN